MEREKAKGLNRSRRSVRKNISHFASLATEEQQRGMRVTLCLGGKEAVIKLAEAEATDLLEAAYGLSLVTAKRSPLPNRELVQVGSILDNKLSRYISSIEGMRGRLMYRQNGIRRAIATLQQ